jgi:hypothetical protein
MFPMRGLYVCTKGSSLTSPSFACCVFDRSMVLSHSLAFEIQLLMSCSRYFWLSRYNLSSSERVFLLLISLTMVQILLARLYDMAVLMWRLFDWLIIYGFTSCSRIFQLYEHVTIADEGLQNLGLCLALRAFEQRGIFIVPLLLWQGPRFSGIIRRTAPFSRLLPHTRGCGRSILTRILTGLNVMRMIRYDPKCMVLMCIRGFIIKIRIQTGVVFFFDTRTSRKGICVSSVSMVNLISEFIRLNRSWNPDNLLHVTSSSHKIKQSSKNLFHFNCIFFADLSPDNVHKWLFIFKES